MVWLKLNLALFDMVWNNPYLFLFLAALHMLSLWLSHFQYAVITSVVSLLKHPIWIQAVRHWLSNCPFVLLHLCGRTPSSEVYFHLLSFHPYFEGFHISLLELLWQFDHSFCDFYPVPYYVTGRVVGSTFPVFRNADFFLA
jgi:hypothetical protein